MGHLEITKIGDVSRRLTEYTERLKDPNLNEREKQHYNRELYAAMELLSMIHQGRKDAKMY